MDTFLVRPFCAKSFASDAARDSVRPRTKSFARPLYKRKAIEQPTPRDKPHNPRLRVHPASQGRQQRSLHVAGSSAPLKNPLVLKARLASSIGSRSDLLRWAFGDANAPETTLERSTAVLVDRDLREGGQRDSERGVERLAREKKDSLTRRSFGFGELRSSARGRSVSSEKKRERIRSHLP